MKRKKKERLEAAGWKVGSVGEFLDLTPEEEAFIELRLALSRKVREQRKEQGFTQARLAKLLGSSQSRVAKIEAGDPSVSLDLFVRSLFALGLSLRDLSLIIGSV